MVLGVRSVGTGLDAQVPSAVMNYGRKGSLLFDVSSKGGMDP